MHKKAIAKKAFKLTYDPSRPKTGLKNWEEKWQFLFCVILSAQSNDDQVNKCTKILFSEFPTLSSFASSETEPIEFQIKSIGLYHNKAMFLKGAAEKLLTNFSAAPPRQLSKLITLPGVGRKTALVYQGVIHNRAEGIAVDTHVSRVSTRLNLSKDTNPLLVENSLKKLFPKKLWHKISPAFFWHGREICTSRKPSCSECSLNDFCPFSRLNS